MASDLVFNVVAWHAEDVLQPDLGRTRYIIKAFGVKADGSSVSLTIRDFTPFFYVKVPQAWTSSEVTRLREHVAASIPPAAYAEIDSFTVCGKKDFWGFSNGRKDRFVRYTFHTHGTMRRVASLVAKGMPASGSQRRATLKLYESNIDPYIRFLHIRNLAPSGWIRVPAAALRRNVDVLESKCALDVECAWTDVSALPDRTEIAPLKVASFDIECTSHGGEFPVARVGDLRRLARDLRILATGLRAKKVQHDVLVDRLCQAVGSAFGDGPKTEGVVVYKVDPRHAPRKGQCAEHANAIAEDLVAALSKPAVDDAVDAATALLASQPFPRPIGDEIIQIGTTTHRYGQRECYERVIFALGQCADVPGARVVSCATEAALLLSWAAYIGELDPDVIIGYNIFGFDMAYINDRADELGIRGELYAHLSRLQDRPGSYSVKRLSSSALGDNELRVIAMPGRVTFDLMKVVQRDHKLDSYKLDNVAEHFTGQRKHDVSPAEIVQLQMGSPEDRARIAAYCVQDCALCNLLAVKLEVVANNVGMSNVCNVPLEYIFMRGQGIKIFSLVLKQCREDGFVIPVVQAPRDDAVPADGEEDGYEGAIVLDPKEGLYIDDPVSVLDYASLYPSSMISENLSHDRIVLDPKYDNLPGVQYNDVTYDVYDQTHAKVGERRCRFAIDEQGVLPRILLRLVAQRKATRKRIELKVGPDGVVGFFDARRSLLVPETSGEPAVPVSDPEALSDFHTPFQKAVLDGLQLAYKVTANSLYGQMGARTSPLYLKDVAACTTATGRNMILKAKAFLEAEYGADVIYGDTDSLFCCFPNRDPETGEPVKGKAALPLSIATATAASRAFKAHLKPPHDLEYEKTFFPFLLLSRKRYSGLKYEHDTEHCKQSSMGIVLKRRDNANIVKRVYGGVLDIIMHEIDVPKSLRFLDESLWRLVRGEYPIEELVITKSLRAEYKDPDRIAHKVLAERIGQRDPGNKPQVNDRVPFVYIVTPAKGKALQGDMIEHPDFVRAKGLTIDYGFYITNQLMRPVCQLYSIMYRLIPGFPGTAAKYDAMHRKLFKELGGDAEKAKERVAAARERDVEAFLFGRVLRSREMIELKNKREKNNAITSYFKPVR